MARKRSTNPASVRGKEDRQRAADVVPSTSGATPFTPAIAILGTWFATRLQQRSSQPSVDQLAEACCEVVSLDLCAKIVPSDDPEQIITFRQPVPIPGIEIAVSIGDDIEGERQKQLRYGSVRFGLEGASVELSMELGYEQRWYFQREVLGALSSSIALAPSESIALTIRNTQRKQFDQETLDEVERSQLLESTIADTDVLNVTRSSSKTSNWNVSGNASISMPKYKLGASASTSRSVSEAASSSAQRTSASTKKSASNLKTIQKVQIRESFEVSAEASSTRRITNPFRDRSLRLNAYELSKEYCVEFILIDISPVVLLTISEFVFDREFILANGGFLNEELFDRVLEAELTEALQDTSNLRLDGADSQAAGLARLALQYLFVEKDLFHLPAAGVTDSNDPASSFVMPQPTAGSGTEPYEISGFQDSLEHKFGIIFTTLAYYYGIFTNESNRINSEDQLAVSLALSLETAIGPRWNVEAESGDFKDVLDNDNYTEVMRRISGFLAMVSGMVRPLMQASETEREERLAAARAEFVIERAINHLKSHSRYYTKRYLHYLSDKTRMESVIALVEEILSSRLSDFPFEAASEFDPTAAFLNENQVVVPLRVSMLRSELIELVRALDSPLTHLEPLQELGSLSTQTISIPTDGIHIEPVSGICLLSDIAPESAYIPINVSVEGY